MTTVFRNIQTNGGKQHNKQIRNEIPRTWIFFLKNNESSLSLSPSLPLNYECRRTGGTVTSPSRTNERCHRSHWHSKLHRVTCAAICFDNASLRPVAFLSPFEGSFLNLLPCQSFVQGLAFFGCCCCSYLVVRIRSVLVILIFFLFFCFVLRWKLDFTKSIYEHRFAYRR